jgi:hypothetical protein
MKLKYILIIILITQIFFLNLSSADINEGNPFFNLTTFTYGPGQFVDGLANFSLTSQTTNTKVSGKISGFEKYLTLYDFLTKNNAQFTCTQNCLTTYSYVQGSDEDTKTLVLEKGKDALVGIRINGLNNIEIRSFSFIISGASSEEFTCSDSFTKIDILDDNSIDWEYKNLDENKNCSDFTNTCYFGSNTITFNIDNTQKCEKINIGKTGKVELAAFVSLTGDPGNLVLSLFDPKTRKQYNCTLDGGGDGATDGFNRCIITSDENNPGFFIDEPRDVYVCISNPGTANYRILGESDNPCGFYGNPGNFDGNFTFDYPLYIRYFGFSPMQETIAFDDSQFSGQLTLKEYIQRYINSRYSGNCQSGCIIPLRFIANGNQTLQISMDNDNYLLITGGTPPQEVPINKFSNITSHPALITMNLSSLSINVLNYSVPSQQGNYNFIFTIGSHSSTIPFKVGTVPAVLALAPSTVFPGKNTTFYVTARPSLNPILSYIWEWGDGSQETTQVPLASHIYDNGTFNLVIRARDSAGLIGSKTFVINAILSRETLNQTFLDKKRAYENLLANQYQDWYRDLIYNITSMNDSLNSIEVLLSSGSLEQIKTQLDSLKIPVSINDSLILQESMYYQDMDKVNLDRLVDLGAGTYTQDTKDKIINAIGSWQGNVTLKLSENVKKITFDDFSSQEITLLTIRTMPQTQNPFYIVFNLPPGITKSQTRVKENINFQDLNDAIGTNLTGSQVINLALPLRQELNQIIFYVSPSFNSLNINNDNNNHGGTGGTSILLPIIVGIVLLIIIIIILIIIWRGKLKSQDIFTNPGDLVNLISYIQTGLQEGKDRKTIEAELIQSGWTKAQINYAFKNLGSSQTQTGTQMPDFQDIPFDSGNEPKF